MAPDPEDIQAEFREIREILRGQTTQNGVLMAAITANTASIASLSNAMMTLKEVIDSQVNGGQHMADEAVKSILSGVGETFKKATTEFQDRLVRWLILAIVAAGIGAKGIEVVASFFLH